MLEVLNPAVLYAALTNFLRAGGPVLIPIMAATLFMWALIVERLIYWGSVHKSVLQHARSEWESRKDRRSWYAMAIRDQLLSQARHEADRFNDLIRALVLTTPLLGLLGTVTGMVNIFDIISFAGSTNTRLMAAGISKATIPTMAGLLSSLSGLFFINMFESALKRSEIRLTGYLKVE